MRSELAKIIEEYRSKGVQITDSEADSIKQYCYRKMDAAGIPDKEGYLPLLFADEVKNYLMRLSVNATTVLRMEGIANVHGVQAISV